MSNHKGAKINGCTFGAGSVTSFSSTNNGGFRVFNCVVEDNTVVSIHSDKEPVNIQSQILPGEPRTPVDKQPSSTDPRKSKTFATHSEPQITIKGNHESVQMHNNDVQGTLYINTGENSRVDVNNNKISAGATIKIGASNEAVICDSNILAPGSRILMNDDAEIKKILHEKKLQRLQKFGF